MESLATATPPAAAAVRRMTCEITLIAHPQRSTRPTLGRLRVLATMKSRIVALPHPASPTDAPRPTEVTRWNELMR